MNNRKPWREVGRANSTNMMCGLTTSNWVGPIGQVTNFENFTNGGLDLKNPMVLPTVLE
jgi:hypothetical protein